MHRFGGHEEEQQLHLPEDDDFFSGLMEHDLEPDACFGGAAPDEYTDTYAYSSQFNPPERPGWSSTNASPSPAVSPPTPLHHLPLEQQNDAWELLQMAVLRLKLSNQQQQQSREEQIRAYRQQVQRDFPTVYSHGKAPCPSPLEQHDWKHRSTNNNGMYKSSYYQGWNRRNTRASAVLYQQQLRQQQQQQQQLNAAGSYNHPSFATYRTVLQQQQQQQQWQSSAATTMGNGQMRAVFLRGSGPRNNPTAGTGVFLPQATGSSRERRKPACSTVLLPARIVEVLNLNVDDLHCQQQQGSSGSTISNTDASGDVTGAPESVDAHLSPRLSKSYSACSPTRWQHHAAPELALPTEWTY